MVFTIEVMTTDETSSKFYRMRQTKKAVLILEDGTRFEGKSFGYEASTSGEVVFNTAMTGYPESLTDPSYEGQILVTTYPILGNYGVPPEREKEQVSEFLESDHIHARAIIAQDYSYDHSHWQAARSLGDWLKEQHIPEYTTSTPAPSPSTCAATAQCSAK